MYIIKTRETRAAWIGPDVMSGLKSLFKRSGGEVSKCQYLPYIYVHTVYRSSRRRKGGGGKGGPSPPLCAINHACKQRSVHGVDQAAVKSRKREKLAPIDETLPLTIDRLSISTALSNHSRRNRGARGL